MHDREEDEDARQRGHDRQSRGQGQAREDAVAGATAGAASRFAATGQVGLTELFPPAWLDGPYGKKFSRCLSRMEEMLGERRAGLTSS